MKNSKIVNLFVKNSYYIIFTLSGNFFIFLYQIYSAKQLTVEDFGILIAFNSLLGIICIPTSIFQISGVKTFVELLKKKVFFKNFFFKKYFISNFYFSTIYLLIVFLFLNFFLDFFYKSSFYVKCIFFLNMFFILISVPFLIYIQSKKKYYEYSLYSLFSSILRFIFLLIFLNLYNNYFSGLIANLLSSFLVFAFLFFNNKSFFFNIAKPKENFFLKSNFFYYLKNVNSSILITVFTIFSLSFDVIFFKELFSSNLAGYFSGISMIAKIPNFILAILVIFFYTESLYFTDKKINSIINFFLFIVFLFSIITVFFLFFYGKIILIFLFNENYANYYLELIILTVAFIFLGISKILLTILISKNQWKILILNFTIIFTLLFILPYSNNILDFSLILFMGFFFIFISTVIYFYNRNNILNF